MFTAIKVIFILSAFNSVLTIRYRSFRKYAVIKVYPKSVNDYKRLTDIKRDMRNDVNVWSEMNEFDSPVILDASPSMKNNVLNELRKSRINYTILSDNLQDWIEKDRREVVKNLKPTVNVSRIDFHRYYPFETILEILQKLRTKYSKAAKLYSIGETYERKPIPLFIIDRRSKKKSKNKSVIVFECGIHAREWISPATCLWFINVLLTNSSAKQLLRNYTFHFIPVANPDGYAYTWNGNRLWRKNRALTNNQKCVGVDLNRNFDVDFCKTGGSTNACDDDYCGQFAFSEKETQSLRDHIMRTVKSSKISIYFAIHSFSQLWMYPFGFTKALPNRFDKYEMYSKLATDTIRNTSGEIYKYGSTINVMSYKVSGASDDWMQFKKLSPFNFAIELRDKGNYGFLLPAKFIKPTAEEVWNAIAAILKQL